jgi:SAM-dependent methyltransferase
MDSWTSGYVANVGYTHGFYRELTPAILGLVSLARSQKSAINRGPLTYCELGCGQGFSTNLLAAANPHVEFYATDFNPAHIVGAQALATDAGTPNVHFFDQSFAEFLHEPSLPAFDIISLHGIYSWIAPEHRASIVEFIRRKLRPGGLVYISYNALPGWSSAAPFRQLMYLHAKSQGRPVQSGLDATLAFTDRILNANGAFFQANPMLKDWFARTKQQNHNYLAHEYLNDAWTLFYHSDVATELSEAKLSFVGSAQLLDHIDVINLTPEEQQILAEIGDPILLETVRDFMVNKQFRCDVFVKGAVALSPDEAQTIWYDRRFALSTNRADVPFVLKVPRGEANLPTEVYQPILTALSDGPRTVRQLVEDEQLAGVDFSSIKQALLALVGTGHLQPTLDEDGDLVRSERTKAFNLAVTQRAQYSTELQFLASPVTGGGIAAGQLAQLFLLGRHQTDPVLFVWDVLNRQGRHLIKQGKPIEGLDENMAELRNCFAAFTTRQLPVLQQLGVV